MTRKRKIMFASLLVLALAVPLFILAASAYIKPNEGGTQLYEREVTGKLSSLNWNMYADNGNGTFTNLGKPLSMTETSGSFNFIGYAVGDTEKYAPKINYSSTKLVSAIFTASTTTDLMGQKYSTFDTDSTQTFTENVISNFDVKGKYFYVVFRHLKLPPIGGIEPPNRAEDLLFQEYYAVAAVNFYTGSTPIGGFGCYDPTLPPFKEVYENGLAQGSAASDLAGFLPSVLGSVVTFFTGTLGNMSIFGISVLNVFMTFVLIAFVGFVLRFVK